MDRGSKGSAVGGKCGGARWARGAASRGRHDAWGAAAWRPKGQSWLSKGVLPRMLLLLLLLLLLAGGEAQP